MLTIQFLVLQVIVFSAVIFFLKKIMYGDTQSAINRLGAVYQDMLNKQNELTQKIEAAEKEYTAKKEEANALADKISAEALDKVREKEGELLKKARAEAEEILSKARNSEKQFYHDIEVEMAKKTIDFSAGLLKAVFNPKMLAVIHQELIKEFIEHIKDVDLSAAGSSVQELVLRIAAPIKKEDLEKLQGVLVGKLNHSVKIQEVTDEELIAGIVLQFGTLVLDGSFASAVKETADKQKEKVV